MDLCKFKLANILVYEWVSLREMKILSFCNKKLYFTVKSLYLPSFYYIYCFDAWRKYIKKSMFDKKYKRKSSWYKKSRNENTELLFF